MLLNCFKRGLTNWNYKYDSNHTIMWLAMNEWTGGLPRKHLTVCMSSEYFSMCINRGWSFMELCNYSVNEDGRITDEPPKGASGLLKSIPTSEKGCITRELCTMLLWYVLVVPVGYSTVYWVTLMAKFIRLSALSRIQRGKWLIEYLSGLLWIYEMVLYFSDINLI